jgi:sulfite reductase alpha subunit-like flavoprotein
LEMLRIHHGIAATDLVLIDDDEQQQHSAAVPVAVETAVTREMDLCSVVKNKRIVYALALAATDPVERSCLQLLASKSALGEQLFHAMVDVQRMNVVDLLQAFPSTQPGMSLASLLSVVPGIPPRYYSVSSSPIQPNNDNRRLSLTVVFSVVDYLTPPSSFLLPAAVGGEGQAQQVGQRRIRGIATRYMEAMASGLLAKSASSEIGGNGGTGNGSLLAAPTLRIFPKPAADFRMPSMLTTPLVLIGPGTGIAPFMGFLQHRRALLHSSANSSSTEVAAQTVVEGTWRGGFDLEENELSVSKLDQSGLNVGADYRLTHASQQQQPGSVDVFFGCRHADHDWLYQDEMKALLESGIVSQLYTAFSRSGSSDGSSTNHQYVQDIMLGNKECGDRLVDLIVNQNAAVYVCGDGNAMAKDVQSAIVELLYTRRFAHDDDDKNNGGGGIDRAKAYLEEMKTKQRFLMDIWS